ncbi:hypothetical protein ABB55_18915 [Prosthecomicrobium hirschii]|uniref:Activator of Hsp90 ATPase homologue 1/2-like C-terminal domain-containing protein n=1 Tax=Prosthecodimorpha hirschii TaxID=665126 RepID=A0A0P6VS61_9HYPH|nr:SRPBCC family protein [Prosthecomicrobium hirschii]KPL54027.1 hypothetical protein ABB55_18915 [Prosthecomicrobium hirschii]
MGKMDTEIGGFGRRVAADTVVIERLLPGTAARLWRYLTEPDLRRQWLAAGAFDLVPGGAIELVFRNNGLTPGDAPPPAGFERFGEESRLEGIVTECDPPHCLAYTWGRSETASQVRFDLLETGAGVRLTVTHSRLADPGAMINVSAGWHSHLDLLVSRIDGREPEGFWRRFGTLEPIYRERLAGA